MAITPAQIHESMNVRITDLGQRLSGVQAGGVYHVTWCDIPNGKYTLFGHDRDGKNYQHLTEQVFITMCCEELTPEQMPDSVSTVCYGHEEVWPDRECAMFFYRDAIANSEGAELERYLDIYKQLDRGAKIARDR